MAALQSQGTIEKLRFELALEGSLWFGSPWLEVKGEAVSFKLSRLYPQSLEHCLVYGRSSISIERMGGWMRRSINRVIEMGSESWKWDQNGEQGLRKGK